MSNVIEVVNLSYSYDSSKTVLNNISFSVKSGSITAIIGRNGCGKSTLLDCISGYNIVDEGTVIVNGSDVKELSPTQLAKNISYISQNNTINIDYRVREFILFGRTCHLKFGETPGSGDHDLVDKAAFETNINHLLNKSINRISGGEKQMAFLARSLVQNSPILILDEPTSALDFGNQATLFRKMLSLQEEGRTIIFTTHNPNHALSLNCDVVIIKDGAIASKGRAESVLTKDLLESLYGIRIKATQDSDLFVFDLD